MTSDRPAAEIDAPAFVRPSREGDEARLRDIMLAVLAADRPPGMTADDVDQVLARLPADRAGTLVALEGDTLAGYVMPRFNDLSVHPDRRRRGHGRRLVMAALDLCRQRGLSELQLWGDTTRPDAAGFIEALGFRYRSSMWLFRLRPGVDVPEPDFPPSVVVRPFRPGPDDGAYVALLNEAFADHPSPLGWSEATIALVHGLPGFDPARILLVAPAGHPERLVGLAVTGRLGPDKVAGEVKFIGLLPEWRGAGLGRELLRWSIRRLRDEGADPIELTVEARNERALRLYRATGFEPMVEWPQWVLPV